MNSNLLKNHLLEVLDGQNVHCGIEVAIEGIPFQLWGKRVRRIPYTLYQLFEHIRLSQRDILEYATEKNYEPKQWPDDYWPQASKPEDEAELENKIASLLSDLKHLRKVLRDKPLLSSLPYGEKEHTIAREAMIAANHLSYHLGQLILMRRLLGNWE